METDLLDMLNKQKITEVLYRYCRGIDRGDQEMATSVWHSDGVADYGPGVYAGSGAGFVDWVWKMNALEQHALYQHRITNILIKVGGNQAVSEAYFAAHILGRNEQGNPHLSNHYGRYADEWSCRNGVWGIDRRTQIFDFFTSDLAEPVPGHRGTRDENDRSHAVLR